MSAADFRGNNLMDADALAQAGVREEARRASRKGSSPRRLRRCSRLKWSTARLFAIFKIQDENRCSGR